MILINSFVLFKKPIVRLYNIETGKNNIQRVSKKCNSDNMRKFYHNPLLANFNISFKYYQKQYGENEMQKPMAKKKRMLISYGFYPPTSKSLTFFSVDPQNVLKHHVTVWQSHAPTVLCSVEPQDKRNWKLSAKKKSSSLSIVFHLFFLPLQDH